MANYFVPKTIKEFGELRFNEMFNEPIDAALHGNGSWKCDKVIGDESPELSRDTLLDTTTYKTVYFYQEGENDKDDWIFLVKTDDDVYVYLNASCNYTGFDCQGGGEVIYSKEFDRILVYGIPESVISLNHYQFLIKENLK